MSDNADYLQNEINKRITLNLIIQGSAQHAFLTSHYLVRDELNEINPDLLRLYDQLALAGFVQYWYAENVLVFGWPDRFWRRASRPGHPFCKHQILARHGAALAGAAKKRAFERCRAKRVTRIPLLFSLQLIARALRTCTKESKHSSALVDLAKRTTCEVWGMPYDQLDGELTGSVAFGRRRPAASLKAKMLRCGAVGYGGVLQDASAFRVVGRGWVWPILSHELVKGTVELICLHGLNELDSATYDRVLTEADRLEYEPWMLQVGAELWRRILPLLPGDRTVAEMVMHMARLPAKSLERLMLAVVEDPPWAAELFAGLGVA